MLCCALTHDAKYTCCVLTTKALVNSCGASQVNTSQTYYLIDFELKFGSWPLCIQNYFTLAHTILITPTFRQGSPHLVMPHHVSSTTHTLMSWVLIACFVNPDLGCVLSGGNIWGMDNRSSKRLITFGETIHTLGPSYTISFFCWPPCSMLWCILWKL